MGGRRELPRRRGGTRPSRRLGKLGKRDRGGVRGRLCRAMHRCCLISMLGRLDCVGITRVRD